MSHEFGPIYDRRDYAGFMRRTLALLIDAAILVAIFFGAGTCWFTLFPETELNDATKSLIAAGWWVFVFIYMFGFRFLERGTPGYRIVGIRYAYVLNRKPGAAAIMLRSLSACVLMWIVALDHFWIIFDERKQSWHDKVSGFYVVKRRAQPSGTRPIVQNMTNVLGLTFVYLEPVESTQHDQT